MYQSARTSDARQEGHKTFDVMVDEELHACRSAALRIFAWRPATYRAELTSAHSMRRQRKLAHITGEHKGHTHQNLKKCLTLISQFL